MFTVVNLQASDSVIIGGSDTSGISATSFMDMGTNVINNLGAHTGDAITQAGQATRKDYVDARGYPYVVVPPGENVTTIVNQTGYITMNGPETDFPFPVVFTLPIFCSPGQFFAIAGFGTSGWYIETNPIQTIYFGTASVTDNGTVRSTNGKDCITIVCINSDESGAGTDFLIVSAVGNIELRPDV